MGDFDAEEFLHWLSHVRLDFGTEFETPADHDLEAG
jgi:hypothetical protein